MREVVLDTETTGLDPASGDRIVEVGCVELVNYIPSGRNWHHYFNPERDVPTAAFEVHGLSTEFLADKPLFADLARDFISFIEGARLVIHNAPFDVGFLNAELERLGERAISMDRVIDTLALARRKHPGASNSLDALCRRYRVDSSARTKHGALLDSELLAEVYVELTGRRQARFELTASGVAARRRRDRVVEARQRPTPLQPRLDEAEISAHRAFVQSLGDDALWNAYEIDD